MSKVRVTLTLEEENVDWMDDVCNNRSAYVDDILTEARKGGYDTQDILTAFERKKLDVEEQQLEAKLQAVKDTKEEFESKEDRQRRETWERALQNITPPKMRSVDTDTWQPDPMDTSVQHFAQELAVTPEEFAQRYPQKREEYDV